MCRETTKKICNECELIFKESDILAVDHLLPRKIGGRQNMENLQLLQTHYPDTKTARNGS
jgi:RNA-directed DNA polymerase